MSIFSSCGILSESSDISSIVESASMSYQQIEPLEEGVFKYTPSMIPVLAKNTAEGTKYLVEFDMLQKLAECNDITVHEAFESVCLENGIDEDDSYVLMDDPEEDLEEKCCAESVADVDTSIDIERRITNTYNDINSLQENGVNILLTEKFIIGSSVNPEIKSKWKENKDLDLNSQFKLINDLYKSCDTIADYKFIRNKLNSFINHDDLVEDSIMNKAKNLLEKCDKKIDELKEEKHANKIAAKEYRRDALKAKREEKKKARAERRAAKVNNE